jgi:photosystem II stability/assembly factor-like uncharacterized protein
MPLLRASASDVTATVKASAQVNAAVGGAVAKGGNSAPPPVGGFAAASATVTQSAVAKSGSGTFSLLRSISFVPRAPPRWVWSSTKFLTLFNPSTVVGSFDGSRIFARRAGEELYITVDKGASWLENRSLGAIGWFAGASYDGMTLVTTTPGSAIMFSGDGGRNFTDITPSPIVNGRWWSIALSSDGTKLAVGENESDLGYIYTATRSGSTWTWTRRDSAGQRRWSFIVGSADGSILTAVSGGNTYRSTDSGATWSAGRSMGVAASVGEMYSSANGSILFGRQNGATTTLFRSVDGGVTWSATGPVNNWRGCSMSADGLKMLGALNGEVWLSETSGSIWTRQPDISGGDMRTAYISLDGNTIAVGSYTSPGRLYFAANQ